MTPADEDNYGRFVGQRKATQKERTEYELAYYRLDKKIGRIAEKSSNPDISPAKAIKLDTKWDKLAAYTLTLHKIADF